MTRLVRKRKFSTRGSGSIKYKLLAHTFESNNDGFVYSVNFNVV